MKFGRRMQCATYGVRSAMDDTQALRKVRGLCLIIPYDAHGAKVWPSIALHLEFNPRNGALADAESQEI